MTIPHSQFIRDRILMFGARKREASAAVWYHPDFSAIYPELLLRMFPVVKNVGHLMATARDVAAAQAGSDPVSALLAPYLAVHTEEEKLHYLWLLEDLERLGLPAERAHAELPSPFVASLVGAQYFWIHHAHPISLIGYMAVLEWEHPPADAFPEIAARTGIPQAALSSFERHAQLDPEHAREMAEQVDSMPLTPEHRRLLGLSILHTSNAIGALYEGVLEAQVSAQAR